MRIVFAEHGLMDLKLAV